MKRRYTSLLVALVAVGFLAACGTQGEQVEFGEAEASLSTGEALPISVTLASDAALFTAGEKVKLRMEIENRGREPAQLLSWLVPVDELEAPVFRIAVDGEPVAYVGPIYKRLAPTEADYLEVRGGQKLTRVIDLTDFYDFSLPGEYTVQYDVAAVELSGRGKALGRVRSNAVTAWIDGREAKGSGKPAPAPSGYNKCTASQVSTIELARTDAAGYANDASSYLAGALGPRYTTWFGAVTAARTNTVKNHFTAIGAAMPRLTFDCSCRKTNVFAYVYPTQPYKVYLCGYFWLTTPTGTDSRAGTLVHESSHFNVVAGTDDYVYGQAGARNLANTNPDLAIFNADNHEYFAENTPFLN